MEHNREFYQRVADSIEALPYPRLRYDKEKNKTLVFIDTRFDPFYKLLFRSFLWSVGEDWNFTIFCPQDVWDEQMHPMLQDMDVEARYIQLREVFEKDNIRYSHMLTSKNFYEQIPEDYLFLFQSDSQVFGRFDPVFLQYPYLGALWLNGEIGNGGTCLRKTRIMETLCEKYGDTLPRYPEDCFFGEALKREGLLEDIPPNIAHRFSIENLYCPHLNIEPVYGHKAWNSLRQHTLWYFDQRLREWVNA